MEYKLHSPTMMVDVCVYMYSTGNFDEADSHTYADNPHYQFGKSFRVAFTQFGKSFLFDWFKYVSGGENQICIRRHKLLQNTRN